MTRALVGAAALVSLSVVAAPAAAQTVDASAQPTDSAQTDDGVSPPVAPGLRGRLTPSFSVAPRIIFRRRGARGAMFDYAKQTVWLSANVHDVLPRSVKPFWPSPVRLSVGRRGMGSGLPAEYVVGLDLDAGRLPGSHPVWMHVKSVLHTLRLPGPALVMGPTGTRALGLYW